MSELRASHLDKVHVLFLLRRMPKPFWYDPETDPSQFMAALWKVRHLCTRAEHVRPTVPELHTGAGDHVGDRRLERETGNREYFWGKPHSAG